MICSAAICQLIFSHGVRGMLHDALSLLAWSYCISCLAAASCCSLAIITSCPVAATASPFFSQCLEHFTNCIAGV